MEMPKDVYKRRIDELGRVVLPLELRQVLNLDSGDTVVFNVEENQITIRRAD